MYGKREMILLVTQTFINALPSFDKGLTLTNESSFIDDRNSQAAYTFRYYHPDPKGTRNYDTQFLVVTFVYSNQYQKLRGMNFRQNELGSNLSNSWF